MIVKVAAFRHRAKEGTELEGIRSEKEEPAGRGSFRTTAWRRRPRRRRAGGERGQCEDCGQEDRRRQAEDVPGVRQECVGVDSTTEDTDDTEEETCVLQD
jgi:hypothetical protein